MRAATVDFSMAACWLAHRIAVSFHPPEYRQPRGQSSDRSSGLDSPGAVSSMESGSAHPPTIWHRHLSARAWSPPLSMNLLGDSETVEDTSLLQKVELLAALCNPPRRDRQNLCGHVLERANPHTTAPSPIVTVADPVMANAEASAAPRVTVCRITPKGNTNDPTTKATAIHILARGPNATLSRTTPSTIRTMASPIQ